jgi:primosomal protein N' (replication factor Y)
LANLFTQFDETEATATLATGPFAGVAIEQGIDRVLDYSVPKKLIPLLRVGQRVRVPLGQRNRATHAYVIELRERSTHPRIKPLLGIEDERVLLSPPLIELALWMSRYYCAPLGSVIDSIIPAAVKKRIGLDYTKVVRLSQPRGKIQEIFEKTKAPKRRAILARLLLLDPDGAIDIVRLAAEAGSTVATVRKLVPLGLITIRAEADFSRLTSTLTETAGDEPPIALNDDQQKVMNQIALRLGGGFSVNLLYGLTGSGKTEIYLQAIRTVVDLGKQAIVLVPEIALTSQTVRRFTARFQRVAVLHSGLRAGERHRFWEQIAQGRADVVVGARSAIFAPVPNPGIIVVDEEHDSSYKQDTLPRYHARDVAIKRAQMQQFPILLGSATPSLESWNRASTSSASAKTLSPRDESGTKPQPSSAHVHLMTLPSRVRGLSLPHVELVDLRTENRLRRGVHMLSTRLEQLLHATLQAGHQAMLLLNRRGYSNFVYCPSCGSVIQCKYCDTTMTYHRSAGAAAHGARLDQSIHTGQLHCHYCLAVNPLPSACPVCSKKLSLFGLGTQRVEEELARKFPELKFVRVDSDSMRRGRDYERTLGRFARKEIQLLLGTQMIAKGLDYPNVTLVGVISGDTALALPDFRAAERTFQLITQVAGRAGRGDAPGRVVVQTFLPDDPSIRHAIKQDFPAFARGELAHRREVGLPPFSRLLRIVLREQDPEKLACYSEELAGLLVDAISAEGDRVKLKGPMPCAIERIAGYFRYQIVLSAPRAADLQRVLARVRDKGALARSERIAVDVDPVSLL